MQILRSVLLVAVALSCGASFLPAQTPLPLDPLTPGERAIADTVARSDARVREALRAGTAQLIHIEFIAVKPAEGQEDLPPRRHAEVLFFLPRANVGLSVLVDLERRQVAEVVRSPGESVPISAAEVDRAVRLALADPGVVRLFGGTLPGFRPAGVGRDTSATRVEAIRTLGSGPADPCYRRRCVVLFFRVDNRYVNLNRVLVDLVGNRVILRENR
jgi:hypothetical protein